MKNKSPYFVYLTFHHDPRTKHVKIGASTNEELIKFFQSNQALNLDTSLK